MKADEIMHVLRLTAMGRINHDDQRRFCEALEKLLAEPEVAEVVSVETAPGFLGGVVTNKRARKQKAE